MVGFVIQDLKTVNLKLEYNTEDDNIIRDLYRPCLKQAVRYDRAVGYFRANIYRELGEDLLDFVISGGKVRIVTSPDIPEPDETAARDGYSLRGQRTEQEKTGDLLQTLKAMAENPQEADCLSMLRLLVENGSLDLYVAIRQGGIYHRKIGLFADSSGNKVVFSGSGNETRRAVSSLEDWCNDETFDVYKTWGEDLEAERALSKENHLNALFKGGTKNTKVRPINEVEKQFLSQFRSNPTLEDCRSGARKRTISSEIQKPTRKEKTPFFYQKEAIKCWEKANHIGMLSMATATGKTLTALFAIKPFLKQGNPILIVVPNKVLIRNWSETIADLYPEVPILKGGGGFDWKANKDKRLFISSINRPKIILVTMDTAATPDFIQFINQAKDLVLVADEAHGLGSETRREILSLNFKAKLGLSATPERLFDEEGSKALTDAFGADPVYSLDIGDSVRLSEEDEERVPILGHFLSPYEYYFYPVSLTKSEQTEWNEITQRIRRLFAIKNSIKKKLPNTEDNEALNLLLIRRSQIVKKAENKIRVVSDILRERFEPKGKWLVYCEDKSQLQLVSQQIASSMPEIVTLQYYHDIASDKKDMVLKYFEKNPSIVVSIKCLDEGANIPAANGAIIVASSSNPRQYIQRRGRVLRRAKGKKHAVIIDLLVLPEEEDPNVPFSIVKGELARAWNFAQNAQNKEIAHELWKKCLEYSVNIQEDAKVGIEE